MGAGLAGFRSGFRMVPLLVPHELMLWVPLWVPHDLMLMLIIRSIQIPHHLS